MSARSAPVATYGLTHLALAVADVERAFSFYAAVFGVIDVYRGEEFIQAQTPGARDVIVFEQGSQSLGKTGGIQHFGFRLINPDDIHAAAERIRSAGGTVTEQGDFVPGEPYLFAKDPDGYSFEVWYELRTTVDP